MRTQARTFKRALDRRKDSSAKKTIRGGGTKRRRFVRGSGSMGFVAVLVILWDSVTTASASFGIEKDGEGSVKWREVVLLKVARLIASDIW